MSDAYFEAFASVYDQFTENAEYKKRADYIYGLLKDAGVESGILLDLACGTGSLTKEFAKKGFDVIGVDNSQDMLMHAREKLADFPSTLFLCQDMRELDLYGTIKACVCALDSVNHLTDMCEVQKVFDRVSLFSESGAVFIFDVNTLHKHCQVLADNTFVYENENSFLVWQNELFDDGETVGIYIDIFTQDEHGKYERFSEDFSERAYSVDCLKAMLEKSGFVGIRVYGDMSLLPPEENEERIIFVCKKG